MIVVWRLYKNLMMLVKRSRHKLPVLQPTLAIVVWVGFTMYLHHDEKTKEESMFRSTSNVPYTVAATV